MFDDNDIHRPSSIARFIIKEVRDSLRVCLVKQTTYPDLYNTTTRASPAATIYSSTLRSGPVALFSYFDADFVIVDVADDVECSTWKERIYHCEHSQVEPCLPVDNGPCKFDLAGNGNAAQRVDDVDWSIYDIVISLDIAVPRRLVERHKSVLWAYYITDDCMGSYRVSRRRSIAGYDCFLNMKFQLQSACAAHEVSAPYQLQYFGCFSDLDPILHVPDALRTGAVVDTPSLSVAPSSVVQQVLNLVGVNESQGDIKQRLTGLCRSKYYLGMGGGNKQGVSIPEAVSAGCLYLGSRFESKDGDLLTSDTYVDTWKDAVITLLKFELYEDLYKINLLRQRYFVDYTCFLRPMADLIIRLRQKRAALR